MAVTTPQIFSTLAGSVMGFPQDNGTDRALTQEIVRVFRNLDFSHGLAQVLRQLTGAIPRILLMTLGGYLVSKKEALAHFVSQVGTALFKAIFYKKWVLECDAQTWSRHQQLVTRLKQLALTNWDTASFSQVTYTSNLLPVFVTYANNPITGGNVSHFLKIEYFRGLHSRHIQDLMSIPVDPEPRRVRNSIYMTHGTAYVVTIPNEFYPSQNYRRLEEIAKANIETSFLTGRYRVQCILIDGEPGLGKSSFAEYAAYSEIAARVYRVDFSSPHMLKTGDPREIFQSVFHNVVIGDSTIFMFDEIDKYLAYHIESSYETLVKNRAKEASASGQNFFSVPKFSEKEFAEHARRIKTDFAYAILGVLEKRDISKPVIVIFCCNNFSTVFEGADSVHLKSIQDRIMTLPFQTCDTQEIKDYMRFYNSRFQGSRFYVEDLDAVLETLDPHLSLTQRALDQITNLCAFDFRRMAPMINQISGSSPSFASSSRAPSSSSRVPSPSTSSPSSSSASRVPSPSSSSASRVPSPSSSSASRAPSSSSSSSSSRVPSPSTSSPSSSSASRVPSPSSSSASRVPSPSSSSSSSPSSSPSSSSPSSSSPSSSSSSPSSSSASRVLSSPSTSSPSTSSRVPSPSPSASPSPFCGPLVSDGFSGDERERTSSESPKDVLTEEIRNIVDQENINLENFADDHKDPSSYVYVVSCEKCARIKIAEPFCLCSECSQQYTSKITSPRTLSIVFCHDCLTGESTYRCATAEMQIRSEDFEVLKQKFVINFKTILRECSNSPIGSRQKKINVVVMFSYISKNESLMILNKQDNLSMCVLRLTVLNKVTEFFCIRPEYITANKIFFQNLTNNLAPIRAQILEKIRPREKSPQESEQKPKTVDVEDQEPEEEEEE